MRRSSSLFSKLSAMLCLVLGTAGLAQGALLNPVLQKPLLAFNSTGTINFDPTTDLFALHADPIVIQFVSGSPVLVTPPPEDIRVRVLIDDAGNVTSNGIVDDLIVEGQIDINGDTVFEYSGVLLTGKFVAFGWEDSSATIDKFDFIFEVTGGQLAPLWAGGRIGMTITSEHSNFVGNFTSIFSGGAKGNIGYLPCPKQAITGHVLCASNNNAPVQNATVTAYDSTNAVVGSTTTAANGSYSIGNLVAGAYTVTVTPPTNTYTCSEPSVIVNVHCSDGATADFCVCPCPLTSIKGVVKCVRDDSAQSGVTVTAYDSTNAVVGSAVTAADGSYTISGLAIGTYTVTVTPPANTKLCDGDTQTVTLVCNQDGTANFCLCPCLPSNIKGSVICNRTDQPSPQENVTVTAYDSANNVAGSAVTAADGTYTIGGLVAGSYTVTVTQPANTTLCNDISQAVVLTCEEDGTANFCLCPCQPSDISGKVTCPRDNNVGISGVTVTAYDSSNAVVGSTTTQADGSYTISSLNPGSYTVQITPIANSKSCGPESALVILECEKDGTADFCLCPCLPSSINGKVTCPRDNNAGVAGATVTAYDSLNAVAGSDTTDVDGSYSISGLNPGIYTVKITPLDNTQLCGSDSSSVTLVCETDGTADFCLCPCLPSNITGKVSCPRDNNAGVAGVSVTAYDSSNAVAGSATTAADGTYSITGLTQGSYTVTIVPINNTKLCGTDSASVVLGCSQDGTANFCLCPCLGSSISGVVACNGAAAPVAQGGITVTVYDGANIVGSAITAANGTYSVPNLAPGDYTVKITVPANFQSCDDASKPVTLVCETNGTANFCLCPVICNTKITGIVKCSSTNAAISGATINVLNASNVVVATKTTGADGKYSVEGLPAGAYTVKVTAPAGYQTCGTTSCSVTLVCNQTKTVDFCTCPICQTASVTGIVKCSSTGQAISGVTVKIYDSSWALKGTATTGSDGKYTFSNLPAANYTIKITVPTGYDVCCGSSSSACVALACGQSKTVNFCVCPKCLPSTVIGTIKCSSTEAAISGITVKIYDGSNVQKGTATTGADGKYTIGSLSPGNYTVKITVPAGYQTCCSGTSVCISLTCGQTKTVSFCLCPPCQSGKVTGTIKCNTNGQAISGVTVKAYDNSVVKGTATTGSDGKYTISNLPAGNYTIKITPPSGYEACCSTSTCVNLSCGQTKTADFCVCPVCAPAKASGTIKCSSGAAISGVTVKAYDSHNNVQGSATTGSDGKYTINDLPAGTLTIKMTVPTGYNSCGNTSSCLTFSCGQSKTVDFCLCKSCSAAKVSGTIKCSSTCKVVSGVIVKIYDGSTLKGSATTGSDGKYTIDNLPAGSFTIKITAPSGYSICDSSSCGVTLSCGQCKTFDVCVCPSGKCSSH